MKKLLLRTMVLLCALVVGSLNGWATTVTKTLAEIATAENWTTASGTGTQPCYTSFDLDDNITISTTGSANCGSYWSNGWRLYQAQSGNIIITAKSGYALQSITITYTVSNTGTLKDGTTNVVSNTAQSVSGSSKTYTVGNTGTATNGQVRISQISVTYINTSDTRTETTVTISGNETSRYMDQSATKPTASVKAGLTDVNSPAVTWTSTATDVATINESTGAITLVAPGTTTIKASYAGNSTYKPSEASYTLNVYGVFSGISALQTATESAPYNTSSGSKAKITFTNALVTYVSGSNAYILDEAGKGALIYQSGHGFTAGKIINGTVTGVTLCLFGGATEIKNVTTTTDGIALTDGTVTPQPKTINAVSTANQSMMVKFESVVYNAANSSFTKNTNTIAYVDKFSVNPSLADGGEYDVTGLLIIDNSTLKVAPIAAEGIVSKKANPTSTWKDGTTPFDEKYIYKANGNKKYTFETNSDGNVTYSSSNEAVATIASDGTITPVGYGTTTITANVATTDNYNADSKSFTLNVIDAGVDVLTASLINQSSYGNWTGKQSNSSAIYAGNSQTYSGVAIQLRCSTGEQAKSGIVTTTSGGKATKIKVAWNSNTADGRSIDIYGKNSPYADAGDLYGDAKGTKIGTLTKGETELTITGSYAYIGIVSTTGALYLNQIEITWNEEVMPVTISTAEYATFVGSMATDFSTTGIKVYTATDEETQVTLNEISGGKVPANTPVVLYKAGADGSAIDVPVIASASAPAGTNDLHVSDGTDVSNMYVLAKKAAGVGFYPWGGTNLSAGKIYLQGKASYGAREFLGFGEPTGVSDIKTQNTDNQYFNLAGQRIAQPTKGLYIVNGKKVVIK